MKFLTTILIIKMKKTNNGFIFEAGSIPEVLMQLPKGMYQIIKVQDEEPQYKAPQDPNYYVELLSEQLGVTPMNAVAICTKINNTAPGALMSLLLMTVARELDLSYPGHISDCSEVYVYSTVNSKIGVIPTKGISKASFKYFAAFRTKEDAVFAIKLVNAIKNFINECQ